VSDDIRSSAARYRAAYSVLHTFNAQPREGLQELKEEDMSTAHVFESERPLGRGYELDDISWIWRMRGVGAGHPNSNWLDEGTCFEMFRLLMTPI
jgi:hypothetical protein